MIEHLALQPGEKLVLASASPRRAELLEKAGIPFVKCPVDFDEDSLRESQPSRLVRLLAEAKAEACPQDGLVLGADTVVALEGRIFGKPANMDEARSFLKTLSGRTHQVHTGVCLRRGNVKYSWTATSQVTFKTLDDSAINEYFSHVNPLDKAGAYAIQQKGELIIASHEGLLSTIIGLPVEEVCQVLKNNVL